jgi:hypothetical protein
MRCRRRQSPTSSTISSVHSMHVRIGRGKVKTRSYLRPVDTPNLIRAHNERLIPPLRLLPTCRTLSFTSFRCRCRPLLSSTRHRYRLQPRYDGLDKVRPKLTLMQRRRDEVGKGHRRALTFFLEGVRVHAKVELVVAVGRLSMR